VRQPESAHRKTQTPNCRQTKFRYSYREYRKRGVRFYHENIFPYEYHIKFCLACLL